MDTAYRKSSVAEIIIEREFGKESLFDLYSAYVSKNILKLLKADEESDEHNNKIDTYKAKKNDFEY